MNEHSAEKGLPTEEEREALDRASSVFGWQHLARYSGMSTEWLNVTLLAIVRSALAAHTCPLPPDVPRDRAPRNYVEQRALLDDSLRDIPPGGAEVLP